MLTYTFRRILIMIPTLLVISFITFTIIKLPPGDFLDRHQLSMRVLETKAGCREQMLRGGAAWAPVTRGADGTWQLPHQVRARGELCFDARLTPGAGGVLTRSIGSAVIRLVPPLRLRGAPIDFGKVKQDASAKARLSLDGSEIGEPIEAKVALTGGKKRFEIDLKTIISGKRPQDNIILQPGDTLVFP